MDRDRRADSYGGFNPRGSTMMSTSSPTSYRHGMCACALRIPSSSSESDSISRSTSVGSSTPCDRSSARSARNISADPPSPAPPMEKLRPDARSTTTRPPASRVRRPRSRDASAARRRRALAARCRASNIAAFSRSLIAPPRRAAPSDAPRDAVVSSASRVIARRVASSDAARPRSRSRRGGEKLTTRARGNKYLSARVIAARASRARPRWATGRAMDGTSADRR